MGEWELRQEARKGGVPSQQPVGGDCSSILGRELWEEVHNRCLRGILLEGGTGKGSGVFAHHHP